METLIANHPKLVIFFVSLVFVLAAIILFRLREVRAKTEKREIEIHMGNDKSDVE